MALLSGGHRVTVDVFMGEIISRFQSRSGHTLGLEKWAHWGARLVTCDNPDGVLLPDGAGKAVMIPPDLPKISDRVWGAWTGLRAYWMGDKKFIEQHNKKGHAVDTGMEVGVAWAVVYDLSQPIQAIVCKQKIGGASVEIDYDEPCINLVSGEVYPSYPPPGMMALGTSHSHNTMWAGFSGTDDANELCQPGMHIVCGKHKQDKDGTWHYEVAPSIVLGEIRYEKVMAPDEDGNWQVRQMLWKDLIEDGDEEDQSFHPDVLDYITLHISTFKWGKAGGYGATKPKVVTHKPGDGGYSLSSQHRCKKCKNGWLNYRDVCLKCGWDEKKKAYDKYMSSHGTGRWDNDMPSSHHALDTTAHKDIVQTEADRYGVTLRGAEDYVMREFSKTLSWLLKWAPEERQEDLLKVIEGLFDRYDLGVFDLRPYAGVEEHEKETQDGEDETPLSSEAD